MRQAGTQFTCSRCGAKVFETGSYPAGWLSAEYVTANKQAESYDLCADCSQGYVELIGSQDKAVKKYMAGGE